MGLDSQRAAWLEGHVSCGEGHVLAVHDDNMLFCQGGGERCLRGGVLWGTLMGMFLEKGDVPGEGFLEKGCFGDDDRDVF